MLLALAGAVSIAAGVAAQPPPPLTLPTARRYPSAAGAVRAALDSGPVTVVAFGELHQTTATVGIPSALRRFTADVLPGLDRRLSHLVVETWMATGRCGEAERAVTADVEKTTERPAATETEIETLIRRAAAGGIVPRILSISCADYQAMRPAGGAVDYDRTLRITAGALATVAMRSLRDRARPAASGRGVTTSPEDVGGDRPLLAIYGGALHNDLHPQAGLEAYSFVPGLLPATLGQYLEIDLVVPEYAAASAAARAQSWWPVYVKARRKPSWKASTIMLRRSPRSFVIVFPPSPGPATNAR